MDNLQRDTLYYFKLLAATSAGPGPTTSIIKVKTPTIRKHDRCHTTTSKYFLQNYFIYWHVYMNSAVISGTTTNNLPLFKMSPARNVCLIMSEMIRKTMV